MRTRSDGASGPALDPAQLSELDRGNLREITKLLVKERRSTISGGSGKRLDVPRPLHELLLRALPEIEEGRKVTLVLEDREVTTQTAAEFLGVSRPFLVKLLEDGKIPYRKVGAHRRIAFKDLLSFAQHRRRTRKAALSELTRAAERAGVYDRAAEHVAD